MWQSEPSVSTTAPLIPAKPSHTFSRPSPLYGASAYPRVVSQAETWQWISTFLDTVSIIQTSRKTNTSTPLAAKVSVLSLRFEGVKTKDWSVLSTLNLTISAVRLTVVTVPRSECSFPTCLKIDRKNGNNNSGWKGRILENKGLPTALIRADILLIHCLISNVDDATFVLTSLDNRATTFVTAITIPGLAVANKNEEENLALPLYDFFHRLYFDYNWLPVSVSHSDCSDEHIRTKQGCTLVIAWTRMESESQPIAYIPPAGTGSLEMELQRLAGLIRHSEPSTCQLKQKFGGHWDHGSFIDGQYTVCLDNFNPKNDCLVYSIGVAGDWSFDDAMAAAGCEVHSFDPSIGRTSYQRADRHWFHDIGLNSSTSRLWNREWQTATLPELRKDLGHGMRKINVLKMDVEGAEWGFLRDATVDGSLDGVEQFIVEIHEEDAGDNRVTVVRREVLRLHGLRRLGFELFHARRNGVGMDIRAQNFATLIIGKKQDVVYELSFIRMR
ncbi:hypothetical protein BV898_13597 [Hypsibius exemplaris]|uniref:Methyltransferase domain-containing protein n=1 Tax=Hypsibius exemplaris TaxID=2072580 RepID=A0A1W0WAA9_HYPEX|nr:hypothetical protein BV898_13597 [Hypsibius exemplaris]